MFTFKQFTINDSVCAMKVGTDGVLLGAWAEMKFPVPSPDILDIGTGSGLIAIMLAQRFSTSNIDAIDIDDGAIQQTQENISASPFSERITAWRTDLADMEGSKKYDLIVSNPPFYKEETSCPDVKRDSARHTSSLSFELLLSKASALLKEGGSFCVILPSDSASDMIGLSAMYNLYLAQRTNIHTTTRKPAKRTLLAFTHDRNIDSQNNELYLRDESNEISAEYKSLTEDFYL